MLANAAAEATGRVLACRLYEMTDDPGMKDMLSFLIARDTMHQQQWLAVIEELGGLKEQLPVPNSFPQSLEKQDFSYVFLNSNADGHIAATSRFTEGPSLDGRGANLPSVKTSLSVPSPPWLPARRKPTPKKNRCSA